MTEAISGHVILGEDAMSHFHMSIMHSVKCCLCSRHMLRRKEDASASIRNAD